jgi:hypothetical protein
LTYVGDVEQVLGSKDASGGECHELDSGRLIGSFRRPVDNRAFLALVLSSVIKVLLAHWAPFKVLDTLDLDTLSVEHAHVGQLVDRDTDTDVTLGNELVVGGPLHGGP